MENWMKRFEFYWYRDTYGDLMLISTSFKMFTFETQPSMYSDSNDTNRWKCLNMVLTISKFYITMIIPYKKLPDYIPSEKHLRNRK